MTPLDDPAFVIALREATTRIEELHNDLLAAHPVLQSSMAVPGMLIGHGLGCLVANEMTDDQIVTRVLDIVAQIRQTRDKLQVH